MTGCCDAFEASGNEREENFGEAREGTRLTPYHVPRTLVCCLIRVSRRHAPNARPASLWRVLCHISFLPRRITGSVNITACWVFFFFYNFLAPTGQKNLAAVPNKGGTGELFIVSARSQCGFIDTQRQETRSAQTPPAFPAHTSTLTRVSRWFWGRGRTCGGVWKAVFFFFEKRGLFLPLPSPNSRHMSLVNFMSATIQHYRHQYPTEDPQATD